MKRTIVREREREKAMVHAKGEKETWDKKGREE